MSELSGIRFGPQIAAAARAHKLPALLLAAVAAQETGGPGASSGANVIGDGGHGRGLFQIDDRFHSFARTPAAMDPAKNADYAAGLLASNLHSTGGNVRAALSMYNAGSPTATGTQTAWPGGRLGYADSVLQHVANLQTRDLQIADAAGPAGTWDPLAALAGTQNAAAASTAAPFGTSGAAGAGLVQVPPFTPPAGQGFRSYSSELKDSGGSISDDVDKRMAAAIDPLDPGGAPDSSSSA